MKRLAVLAAAAAVLAGLSCNEQVLPEPGRVIVVLSGAQPGDAALLLSVTGPDSILGFESGAGLTIHARPVADGLRVAAFGPIADGAVLYLTVPDTRRAPLWTATVLDVADTANAVRQSVSGYLLVVAR